MNCPKCGMEQDISPTCMECGIVFKKYYEIQNRTTDRQSIAPTGDNPDNEPVILKPNSVLENIRHLWSLSWQPVSTLAMVSLSVGFFVMVYLLATKDLLGTDSLILHFTHDVNLIFHEAGHWIFGIFGNRTLAILGGSLNQVLIPFIVACSFWSRKDTVGFAFGLFWLFENFLDVSIYMADARALALPLIGGLGEDAHDWRNLFFQFGLINQDTAIAAKVWFIGWVGIVGAWVWFLWRWLVGRKIS